MSEKSFYNKIRSQRHTADGSLPSRSLGATAWRPVRLALVDPRAGRPLYGSLAQSVKQVAVNHRVPGSIPGGSVGFLFSYIIFFLEKGSCNTGAFWLAKYKQIRYDFSVCFFKRENMNEDKDSIY